MLGWWTLSRASGLGFTAGLLALLLWPFHDAYDALEWPFLGLIAVAALSGASILAITLFDILFHARGRRMRPVRVFDVVLGAALVALSLLQLHSVAGQWPA